MPSEPGSGSDVYAPQKANIRDTVKYMAAAYAACGAVIFAGASLSNLGSLSTSRLIGVVFVGAIALVCVFAGIRLIFNVLIGDFVFASKLEPNAKAFIDENKKDLLSDTPYDDFLKEFEQAKTDVELIREEWKALPAAATAEVAEQKNQVKARYDQTIATHDRYDAMLARTISFAHLFVLQERLKTLQAKLGWLTLVAIVSFGIAVLLVTNKSAADADKCELRPQLVM